MGDLYPTKTRLALLRDVAAQDVIDGDASALEAIRGHVWLVDTVDGPAQKVTVRIAEMERAGWVELPDGDCWWRLTDAGREVLGG